MNQYQEMRDKQQQAINAFAHENMFFAFSNDQFNDGLTRHNVTINDIVSIGAGGYLLKSKRAEFAALNKTCRDEINAAIAGDPTGDGFIYDMFYYELNNHEYIITGDVDDTLDALNITAADLDANPALRHGLKKACDAIIKPDELPTVELTGEPEAQPTVINMPEWHPESLNGYVPMTTFWQDFSIADNYGLDAVRRTYNRTVNEWHDNYKYVTELILVLNHKIWQWHEQRDDLALLYNDLWRVLDAWARDNFTEEQQQYLFKVTD